MPNHIKNKVELIGSLEDIDMMIKQFGTYVPATLNKTHDGDLLICKSTTKEWGFCWYDLKTGRSHNRNDIDQLGLPEGFEIEINDARMVFPHFEKVIPPPDDPAYKDIPSQDVAQHSPNWWYNWNRNNWGTKWGGYSYERPAINQFTFETAWASVPLIIDKISKAFPRVTIKYTWADEDTGYNCGRALYVNGLLEEDEPEGGTKEAYDIAFELRPDRAENYVLDGNKYRYVESEE